MTIPKLPMHERYVFLKKSLCILELIRLGGIVNINGHGIDYSHLRADTISELEAIKNNFTLPVNTMTSGLSTIDLSRFSHDIKTAMVSANTPTLEGWGKIAFNRRVNEGDIYHTPNFKEAYCLFKKDFDEKNGLWGDLRVSVSLLLNTAQDLSNGIYSYLQSDMSQIDLRTVIFYTNILELIDWVFTLSEEGEGIFKPVTMEEIE